MVRTFLGAFFLKYSDCFSSFSFGSRFHGINGREGVAAYWSCGVSAGRTAAAKNRFAGWAVAQGAVEEPAAEAVVAAEAGARSAGCSVVPRKSVPNEDAAVATTMTARRMVLMTNTISKQYRFRKAQSTNRPIRPKSAPLK